MARFDDGIAAAAWPTGDTVTTDVLVVGSGPAGASAALFLSTLGVDNMMIIKYRWTANTPRAHITNQRTMEIFRDVGVEDQVLAEATPHELMGDTVFCTSIAGEEVGRILTWGTHPARHGDYRLASPSRNCDIPQTYLEPILVDNATVRRRQTRFSTEYLSHAQDEDGVTVQVRDRLLGVQYAIRAKYTWVGSAPVWCARDIVRNLVGVPDLAVEITGTSLWGNNEQYATTLHRGRVFCAGDAVHKHPPSNGLGSNTSIQDSYNLAWKLAAVLAGHAGAALLDTYTTERGPVAEQIVTRANQSSREFVGFFDAQREVAESGAILVRPDKHVGWRAEALPADPRRELHTAMAAILHRSESWRCASPTTPARSA